MTYEPHFLKEARGELRESQRELKKLLDAFEYKPGTLIRLHDNLTSSDPFFGLRLELSLLVRDSRPPHHETRVYHIRALPDYVVPDWKRWLLEFIFDAERHEAMEFFRVNGTLPYDPHADPPHDPYVVREVTAPSDT